MQTLDVLQRRIKSAGDLQSVVRTMKTLAAVSIGQYEQAAHSLAEYYRTVEDGLRMLLWQSPRPAASARPEPETKGGIVAFGSDQGMCGQFNDQMADWIQTELDGRDEPLQDWTFLCVGLRLSARLQEAGLSVEQELAVPGSVTGITTLAEELLTAIERWQSRRPIGRILVFYNRRISASSYRPHVFQLLPIDPEWIRAHRQRKWPSRSLPLISMDRDRLLSALVRQYFLVSLFRACAESLAAENAARIASMQAAEQNIEDRLTELRRDYHQLRQTAITEELLDVVTGFEALTQAGRQ